MAGRTKLSGAALAAELTELSFPGATNPEPTPQAVNMTAELAEAPSPSPLPQPPRSQGDPRPRRDAKLVSRGGRPAKAGIDGIPVNVRLSQADHLALAKLASKLMVPGRPLPTVQDVVRSVIRGALGEPELALRLCRQLDA
jgi:hypothetical protein